MGGRFFANQFSNSNPVEIQITPDHFPTNRPVPCPFNVDSIREEALNSFPRGKAAGHSGLIGEALTAGADTIALPLLVLFQKVWDKGEIPDSWRVTRIHPVAKTGDLTKITNYRPISLMEVLRRVFEGMLVKLIEQGGFRHDRGTLDQATVLHEWIIQLKKDKRDRFLVFLDIKSAYDQVDRSLLWEKCNRIQMHPTLLQVLKGLLDDNRAHIAINGSQSPSFPLISGVLQGSPLSPVLYSLFINDIVQIP
jgi:hypothetical protein